MTSAASKSPLEDLAATISASAKTVTEFLRKENHAQPSFSPDGPLVFPPDAPSHVSEARMALVDAARQIQVLALFPREAWTTIMTTYLHASVIRFLYHFDIPTAIPLSSSISFAEVAAQRNVDVRTLTRVLRFAMTDYLFCEPVAGRVTHTAMSRLYLLSPELKGTIGFSHEEGFPASLKLVEATEKWGRNEKGKGEAGDGVESDGGTKRETVKSAFNLAFDTDVPCLEYMAQDPARNERFAQTMSSLMALPGRNVSHLVEGYDWKGLGNGLVVDVGGSTGQVSKAIAAKAPDLHFIVQDLPNVISMAQSQPSIYNNITYSAHDFFTPNPVSAGQASVFLLRQIMHDWPDTDAVTILSNIATVMTPTTKIIVSDILLQPQGTLHPLQESWVRFMDLYMCQMFNSRERSLEEFEELCEAAKPALQIVNVETPVGSDFSIVEIMLKNEG